MRKLFFCLFILSVLPMIAQNITEQQKNSALSKARQFCALLSQYSNGGEQFISNDEKIFSLCSSQNITAYDDLDGNKEDLLVSYLFTIMGNYDNKLEMVFSQPKIEQVFAIPIFDLKIGLDMGLSCEIVDYDDVYVILQTTQTMNTLNKSTQRKIIYSCNEDKIIAFTTGNSPYVVLQKALVAFSQKDYKSVYALVDQILSHKRFDQSAKQGSIMLAMLSDVSSGEVNEDRIKKYGSRLSKKNAGFYNLILGIRYVEKNDLLNALPYLELAADANEDGYYMLGSLYSVPGTTFRNVKKAIAYFTKGIQSKDDSVLAQSCYYYSIMAINYPNDFHLSTASIKSYLKSAAERNFVPAYLPYSIYLEREGNKAEASVWDRKAMQEGSSVGKARYGAYLISSSDLKLKEQGMKYLREAANEAIDEELNTLAANTGLEPIYPKDVNDVKRKIR